MSGTFAVSRTRVLVLGLTVVLGASLSTRVASEVDRIDLTKVTYGLHEWETEPDGTRFRWTGGRARLFVPPTATDVTLPLRALFVDNREAIEVEIAVDNRPSRPLRLVDEEWHMHRLHLPHGRSGAHHRTVDLRVTRPWRPSETIPGNRDTRELGLKLGEVQVVAGISSHPLREARVHVY